MRSALTRRSIVAAAPAAIVAAADPVQASGNPDAALLALRGPFERTWKAYVKALNAYSLVEFEHGADLEGSAAIEADAVVRRTSSANRKIVEAMCEIPARTIEGLAFKAKVSDEHEDNLYEDLIDSIMRDILAMSGGAYA